MKCGFRQHRDRGTATTEPARAHAVPSIAQSHSRLSRLHAGSGLDRPSAARVGHPPMCRHHRAARFVARATAGLSSRPSLPPQRALPPVHLRVQQTTRHGASGSGRPVGRLMPIDTTRRNKRRSIEVAGHRRHPTPAPLGATTAVCCACASLPSAAHPRKSHRAAGSTGRPLLAWVTRPCAGTTGLLAPSHGPPPASRAAPLDAGGTFLAQKIILFATSHPHHHAIRGFSGAL